LGEQDGWLGAVADTTQLFALVGVECDLSGAEGVYACDSTPIEAHPHRRLLRLAKRVVGQPFRNALSRWARDGFEGADRVLELGQRPHDGAVDAHICAGPLERIACCWRAGDGHRRWFSVRFRVGGASSSSRGRVVEVRIGFVEGITFVERIRSSRRICVSGASTRVVSSERFGGRR
jgi:hypothetical protein